ncbi:MAG TPA: hypothetical protein VMV53_11110 [Acidimicrobiales bacterium]|nr:hypothetical protein [Acidimicrobiales bacterium]
MIDLLTGSPVAGSLITSRVREPNTTAIALAFELFDAHAARPRVRVAPHGIVDALGR